MKQFILPNFLIIGAQKAASTAIYDQLKYHHDIFLSKKKEISYFTYDYNYQRGLKYYSTHFQNWNGEKAIGEATPGYLHKQNVPGRIHAVLPNIKLIVSLRDPIDRAYSAYLMQLTKGTEPPDRSFEEAVHELPQYLEYGNYYEHLQRYLRYFSLEQIHIILYDDLKSNPQNVYKNIFDFLEIDRIELDKEEVSRSNPGGTPKNRAIQSTLNFLYRARNHIRDSSAGLFVSNRIVDMYSRKIRNRIASWNRNIGSYERLSPEVRQRLLPLVREANDSLALLINRDLSSWNI